MTDGYDAEQIRSVHLVPLTAFNADGSLNRELQAEHISRLYRCGMRVFMPAAGTSEFHSLLADEIVDIVRITREASGPDAQIFAPVGLQVDSACDVGIRSMKAGATGIMFMPLAHPYLSDAGAKDYYQEIIDAVDAPTLIYKKAAIPSDVLLLELADDPRVVGVKYAVNDMHEFRKVVTADEGRIEWLCGTAERFAPYYMLVGATGFTTGAGNLCPCLSLAMHAAFASGEYEEGLRLQQMILPIEDYRAREGDSFNVSMLKYAMSLLGSDFGPARPPMRKVEAAERAEIDSLMEPILAAEEKMQQELVSVGLSNEA